MDDKKLRKANELKNSISNTESDIRDIRFILDNYELFRSNLEFKRDSGTGLLSKSFGSTKYKFKDKLFSILLTLEQECKDQLEKLNIEYDKL